MPIPEDLTSTGTIPSLFEDFEEIVELENETTIPGYELARNMEYKGHKMNIVRYKEKEDEKAKKKSKVKENVDVDINITENEEEKEREFTYITDLPIDNGNIEGTIKFVHLDF